MNQLLTIILMCWSICSFSQNTLFPGEKIIKVNGVESLVYFSPGDSNKPLLVFIPGDSHLARIAYGYPAGNPKNFLAYWLKKEGYPFLALSYPLKNAVYSQVYPDFTIQDWGEQAATIISQTITDHQLKKKFIILGWSMGGSIENRLTQSAHQKGLDVQLFIGLASMPPLPFIMQKGQYDTNIISKQGLADRRPVIPLFYQLVQAQEHDQGEIIIPKKIYEEEFVGDIPAALSAEGYWHQGNKIISNTDATLKDAAVLDFSTTPWIALLVDTDPGTAKISLIDPASWYLLRSEMIYARYLKGKIPDDISPQRWQAITDLINSLYTQLTLSINGNHFFFIGEKGAQETAEKITILIQRVEQVKSKLNQLIPQ
ncbi:hypothetical protein [Legionella bononiensis]|uniref:Alpha/beta hydrolase family protein n=1 Tax=Legionella bononiensis TaxID=2793102 RepID=A0ABS1W749_9GAMM|nr:hypothetical protein [Legionella bononiensis]MBL7481287.1 hypothetical protein [Legionella bononiensis]MBL7525191.1 hypothetical protein [Legionella bononiensis]MBL7561374.1 hypothetical protein [Legionella bononiensis]